MNVQVKILNIKTVNELPLYWTNDDFIQLLDKMNLPDAAIQIAARVINRI